MYNPKVTYRFLLDSGAGFAVVTPIYGSDIVKETSKPNEQEYSREEMKGVLTFMKGDFETIMAASFNHDFILKLQRDVGAGYVDYVETIFNKTDCEFDEKNKSITVSPEPHDKYRKVLGSMDKKYNLISLSPQKTTIQYIKQSIIQIYIAGTNYLTNFTKGISWEQKVDSPISDHNVLLFSYYFGWGDFGVPGTDNGTQVYIPGDSGGGLIPDVSGTYKWDSYERGDGDYRYYNIGHHPDPADPTNRPEGEVDSYMDLPYGTALIDDFDDVLAVWKDSLNNEFEFIGIVSFEGLNVDRLFWRSLGATQTPTGSSMTHVSGGVYTTTFLFVNPVPMGPGASIERGAIYDVSASNFVYFTKSVPEQLNSSVHDDLPSSEKFKSTTSTSTCQFVVAKFYTRMLCDLAILNGDATFDIPVDDIVPSAVNFTKVGRLELPPNYIYDGHSPTNGNLGKFNEDASVFANEYFSELLLSGGRITLPINRTVWDIASYWFWHTAYTLDSLDQGAVNISLKDAFHLHNVIAVLLNEIDPTVTFVDDVDYSEFLYSEINPVSNEAQPRIFITPKSNVVVSGYDKPAEIAELTYMDVLTFIVNAYNLRWFIDSSNRFRLEHISWFENGGSYTTKIVGTDLTALIEGKTKKPWSFGANKYKYKKSNIPERIKFGWMDEVSSQFKGYPIQVLSKYAQLGNIKDKSINKFTSDIDFTQGQPSAISHDGFFVFAAIQDVDGIYTVPFLDIDQGVNKQWSIQNGHLSMIYLHDKFHRHGLPAINVNLNEVDIVADSVVRNKIQSLEYPAQIEPNPVSLVKTDLGKGQVESITVNIGTNETKLTIRHDTE